MTDDRNPFELDLDGFYERYLKTCAMSGVTPVSRERALGLVQEWSEVLEEDQSRRGNSSIRLRLPNRITTTTVLRPRGERKGCCVWTVFACIR